MTRHFAYFTMPVITPAAADPILAFSGGQVPGDLRESIARAVSTRHADQRTYLTVLSDEFSVSHYLSITSKPGMVAT